MVRRCIPPGWLAALVVFAGGTANASVLPDDWRFASAHRVVAVADIHGAYDAFFGLLEATGLVDDTGNWVGHTSHLVIAGDMLDRGADSRRVMDLVMQLEREAETAGGRVHVVLGNHELMNLVGDMRYVSAGEIAAFADAADPAVRAAARARYGTAEGMDPGDTGAAAAFDERFPPGWFAHRAAFGVTGRYGRWLLDKPMLLVIGRDAFVHGGIPPSLLDAASGDLAAFKTRIVTYLADRAALVDAGVIEPWTDFTEETPLIAAFIDTPGEHPADLVERARQMLAFHRSDLHGEKSPLWYRGSVQCSAFVESRRLTRALERLGADRVVVGHTPTPERRVLGRFGDRVLRIDTGMLASYYHGRPAALVLENGSVQTVYGDGSIAAPVAQPRRVAHRLDVTDDALERILATHDVLHVDTTNAERWMVRIAHPAGDVPAVFLPASKRQKTWRETAAYRLDRLLGLDQVPVTVRRTIDATPGQIQLSTANMPDELQRAQVRAGGDAWCPLVDQFNAMYAFDALTNNLGRGQHNMHYLAGSWDLVTTGFETAFDRRGAGPAYLERVAIALDQLPVDALAALDEAMLDAALDGLLDKKRIRAILKRRDALLDGKWSETRR